jgi:hypothetical protein
MLSCPGTQRLLQSLLSGVQLLLQLVTDLNLHMMLILHTCRMQAGLWRLQLRFQRKAWVLIPEGSPSEAEDKMEDKTKKEVRCQEEHGRRTCQGEL